jgi:hypothetical protein
MIARIIAQAPQANLVQVRGNQVSTTDRMRNSFASETGTATPQNPLSTPSTLTGLSDHRAPLAHPLLPASVGVPSGQSGGGTNSATRLMLSRLW